MSYIIGSFNMLNANFESNEKQKKDYKKIAKIIKQEKFDVVALQEVWTDGVLEHGLMKYLGKDKWDYKWQSPSQFSSRSAEGYAYIWKKSRFRLVESGSNPTIENRYKIRNNGKNLGKQGLIRPPYVIRLTTEGLSGGSFMELRLINTHVIFGKPSSVTADFKDIELRKKEIQILAEKIYPKVADKRYGKNMPAYTIMMGDYNLCLVGPGPKLDDELTICSYPHHIKPDRKLRTVQEELSSLKQPDSVDEKEIFTEYYAHNYDHFSYEESLEQKLKLKVSRVDALGKYCDNNLKEYRREISDHVPIKLIINLK